MRHLLATHAHFEHRKDAKMGTVSDPYYFNHSTSDHTQHDAGSTTSTAEDVWFDFMADCGDGFDSSYSVARMLSQPNLRVGGLNLQRGKILLIGGDLAYPNPTKTNFEERFVRVFEDGTSRNGRMLSSCFHV